MKAGIVAVPYKAPAIEKALAAAGFSFEALPFGRRTLITVEYAEGQFSKLEELCEKLTFHGLLIAESSQFKKL